MIKIAEVMSPNRTPLWDMVKQCGVNYVVGSFHGRSGPDVPRDDLPWSYTSVMRMKTAYADGGFQMDVIEEVAPAKQSQARAVGSRRRDRTRLRPHTRYGQAGR